METRRLLQDSITYIEENLKAEITAQEIADVAGFSLYHYYRLFQSAVGMPVMQYVVYRKLLNAIYEISCGRKMVDVALEYGFDTYAGFYRAFQREFGCTPKVFLKEHKVKKPYPINLLKEEHIMVAHKKITEILNHWNLEEETITDIYYEGTGNKNENACYVGDSFVLKFTANWGNLKKNIELSKAIAQAGLYAATPVKTKENAEYVKDGELYFCLTKRLDGKQMIVGDMYEEDYESKAYFVGKIIGKLHQALQKMDVAVDDVNLYENVQHYAMPMVKEVMQLPAIVYDDYENVFGKLYEQLPKQLIHRDPNPGNLIFNGDQWGFLDFELAERNLRIFDPCYATTAILSESFTENDSDKLEKWVEIYKNIVSGYDSVAKLSDCEKQAIPYVVLSNQLVCVAWFAKQEKYKDIFETNKKMTEWMGQNFDALAIK